MEARKAAIRATWIEAGRTVRRCFVCRKVKDLERDFYNYSPALPGSRYSRNMPCKVCAHLRRRRAEAAKREHTAAKRRAAAKRYAQRHPDRITARNKRRWKAIKADPLVHAQYLEDNRINRRIRAAREGRKVRNISTVTSQPERTKTLPAAPVVEMIERMLATRNSLNVDLGLPQEGIGMVCRELGIGDRNYRRWRSGEQSTLKVETAEALLMAADVEFSAIYSYDDHRGLYEVREEAMP